MFISDKLIFIELPKTGCTHITKLLSGIVDGNVCGKHNPATADHFREQDRVFIGSIRDPWELYVSIWAFGCDKKGGLYERVTRSHCRWKENSYNPRAIYKKIVAPHCRWGLNINNKLTCILVAICNEINREPDIWKNYYTNADDAESFRNWLKMIYNPKFRFDFGEGYGFSSIYKFAGLLTYRYLSLFCRNNNMLFSKKTIFDFDSLREFERENLYISYFIRNENLENDFINALTSCGIKLSDAQKDNILRAGKTNTSSRCHEVGYYYDQETIELVRDREKLIVEKFGYSSPVVM